MFRPLLTALTRHILVIRTHLIFRSHSRIILGMDIKNRLSRLLDHICYNEKSAFILATEELPTGGWVFVQITSNESMRAIAQINEKIDGNIEVLKSWECSDTGDGDPTAIDLHYKESEEKTDYTKYMPVVEKLLDQTDKIVLAGLYDPGWKYAGNIAVDSGLVHVGDPCYLANGKGPYSKWSDFMTEQMDIIPSPPFQELNFAHGGNGLGIISGTTYGDGRYPVFVKLDGVGQRPVAIHIAFDLDSFCEDYED